MLDGDKLRARLGELVRARRLDRTADGGGGQDGHPLVRYGSVEPVGVEAYLPGGELRGERGAVWVHERMRSAIERPRPHWGTLHPPATEEPDLCGLAERGLEATDENATEAMKQLFAAYKSSGHAFTEQITPGGVDPQLESILERVPGRRPGTAAPAATAPGATPPSGGAGATSVFPPGSTISHAKIKGANVGRLTEVLGKSMYDKGLPQTWLKESMQNALDSGASEVPSTAIGESVLAKLKEIDQVAYIRFASVYREFRDLDDWRREMAALDANKTSSEAT